MKIIVRSYSILILGIIFWLQMLLCYNVVNAQIGSVVEEIVQNHISEFQENDIDFVHVGFRPITYYSNSAYFTGTIADSGCCFRRSILLTSFDAGVSWEDSGISIDGSGIQEIFVLDNDHIWFLYHWEIESPGPPITIVRTDDGGKSWEIVADTFEHGSGLIDEILRFTFNSPEHGELVVSYTDTAINVFKTLDGGNTWALEKTIDFSEFYGDGYNENIESLKDSYRKKQDIISLELYKFDKSGTPNKTIFYDRNADDFEWSRIDEFSNTFYISSGKAFPISEIVEDYYYFIDNLDSTKKESILSAKNRYRELFIDDNENAEVAFRIFLDLFRRVIKNNEDVFYIIPYRLQMLN